MMGSDVNQLQFSRHTAYQEAKIDTEGWERLGIFFFYIQAELMNP